MADDPWYPYPNPDEFDTDAAAVHATALLRCFRATVPSESRRTMADPYWRMERHQDVLGGWHEQWVPSPEMEFLMGCLLSTQEEIEKHTLLRPDRILLPADRLPPEAQDGGSLLGIPFEASGKVTTPSLVYPVRFHPAVDLSNLAAGTTDRGTT